MLEYSFVSGSPIIIDSEWKTHDMLESYDEPFEAFMYGSGFNICLVELSEETYDNESLSYHYRRVTKVKSAIGLILWYYSVIGLHVLFDKITTIFGGSGSDFNASQFNERVYKLLGVDNVQV